MHEPSPPRSRSTSAPALSLGRAQFSALLLVLDTALTAAVVLRVPYTEIDWVAYMQQIAGVLNGTRDYAHLRGDTGPLVYPGAHVGAYTLLYALTDAGALLVRAQVIFAAAYIATLALALALLVYVPRVPTWALCLLVVSKRVHSIFTLRLFNDGLCILLVYAALACLVRRRHAIACIFYSLAVGVKMSALLGAPGLLVVLLRSNSLERTAGLLALCALVQVVVAAPFLVHWQSYAMRAFDLGRVFEQRWSVNWQMLPEWLFIHPRWALALLMLTLIFWVLLAHFQWLRDVGGISGFARSLLSPRRHPCPLSVAYTLATFQSSVLVGIIFARSLHYQFYAMYFHSLPLLLWLTPFPTPLRVTLFAAVELVWSVYPPQATLSWVLLAAHTCILIGLLAAPEWPDAHDDGETGDTKKAH